MELKLNIKNKGKVVKTYTANTYDIEVKILENLIRLIDIEKLVDKDGNLRVGEIVKIVVKNYDEFKELIHDVFPEMTDEEYLHISIFDLKDFFVDLGIDVYKRLFNFTEKN